MTPTEMRFQLHLAQAICNSNWAGSADKAKQHLIAAEAIVLDAEETDKPPPPPEWVLRYMESGHYLCQCPKRSGQFAPHPATEHDLCVVKFPTESVANDYARHVNIWKLVQVMPIMPPVERLA